jgi:DNA repair protein RecO (recombination protein O)
LPGDPLKSAVLMFFNELLLKVLKEEEPEPALFDFVMKMLITLDEQKPLHPSYHLSVMLNLARYLGFFPQNGNYSPDLYFDLREGKFLNAPLLHHDFLSPELSRVMNELISIPFDEYQQFRVPRSIRNDLLDALISFYRLHIAGFGLMKSVSVLRALFD